jgi:hypothetical protein
MERAPFNGVLADVFGVLFLDIAANFCLSLSSHPLSMCFHWNARVAECFACWTSDIKAADSNPGLGNDGYCQNYVENWAATKKEKSYFSSVIQ